MVVGGWGGLYLSGSNIVILQMIEGPVLASLGGLEVSAGKGWKAMKGSTKLAAKTSVRFVYFLSI